MKLFSNSQILTVAYYLQSKTQTDIWPKYKAFQCWISRRHKCLQYVGRYSKG